MLTSLSISNYALIKELQTDFTNGLSIITGETGAGKSIVLGALGLVMGNRADSKSLKNLDKKCIIEAVFSIKAYGLIGFFKENDIDYEQQTIIRREILPSGKSRAFVNDTPVVLSVLNELKDRLIDVHSQHKTAQLSQSGYQFYILDALAGNSKLLAEFSEHYEKYKTLKKELAILLQNQEISKQEYAYNSHLFNELQEADLKSGEQEELEENLDKLNNIGAISSALAESIEMAKDEQVGLQVRLYQMKNTLHQISGFSSDYEGFTSRVESLKIELDDIVFELDNSIESIDVNPEDIEKFNDRLQLIYTLQKKHMVSSLDELLNVKDILEAKVSHVENASEILEVKEREIKELSDELILICSKIHDNRKSSIPTFTSQLEEVLSKLGMSNATFKIDLEVSKEFYGNGNDTLKMLFSANKGGSFDELKKVASGGEMSRIMLGVKLILSKYTQLPTIIFDEIDTGVSGEVSNKIADVMKEMSDYMQVITITHLPQIAAKGDAHYKVYKEDVNGITSTFLKHLSFEERVSEVAEILDGKNSSDSAIEHARELLKA